MKHLFVLHSHITFLVSKQFIHERSINPDDCLFLCMRNYKIANNYSQEFIHSFDYPKDLFGGAVSLFPFPNIKKGYENIRVIEKFVHSFCGQQDFTLYAFNTAMHLVSILVTMPQCAGYYLIEEGLSAYKTKKQLWWEYTGIKSALIRTALVLFFKRFYLLKDHCFSEKSSKCLGTIATNERAYAFMSCPKYCIQIPFDTTELQVVPQVVLSIDGNFLRYGIALDEINKVFEELAKKLNIPDNSVIAYKFHPMYLQQLEVRNNINRLLAQNFGHYRLYELSTDIMLENVLKTYGCMFISDYSSVGIYAHQMGCECISYANIFIRISKNKKYANEVRHLPKIITDSYKKII